MCIDFIIHRIIIDHYGKPGGTGNGFKISDGFPVIGFIPHWGQQHQSVGTPVFCIGRLLDRILCGTFCNIQDHGDLSLHIIQCIFYKLFFFGHSNGTGFTQ